MSESSQATRTTIQIGTRMGTFIVDGFKLSDGSYRMSLTQSSGAIGFGPQSASDFLSFKAVNALLAQGNGANDAQLELAPSTHTCGRQHFRAMSLEAVAAYWQWQASRGNRDAVALCVALQQATLSCRFDNAFGVERSDRDCS